MSAIIVKNLSKYFGKNHALENVSFEVKAGSITGFLGPNGAGKSTTMNVLMGFLSSTGGTATVLGEPVSPDMVVRKDIGFLSANMALDGTLTSRQEIEYFAALSKTTPDYGLELAKELDLDLSAKIKTLSTGNHQKVALIVALLARPKLLILDEPTSGLDPLVQAIFTKIVKDLSRSGTTIFISSHILSEISDLCDHFIFIKKGQIVASLAKKELQQKSNETLTIPSTPDNIALLKKHNIKYKLEPADLEKAFQEYYA